MKKGFNLLLMVIAATVVGVGNAVPVQAAKSSVKVLRTKQVKKTAYHATKGTIYTTNRLTKVAHYAKHYRETTLYVTKQSTVKKNHKQFVYDYIVTKKARGWIWHGYLKRGIVPTKRKATTATFNATAANADFLTIVNQERKKTGAVPLTTADNLTKLAMQRAMDSAKLGDLSHVDSHEQTIYLKEGARFGVDFSQGWSSECLYMADEGFVGDYQSAGKNAANEYLYNDASSNWGHRKNLIAPEAKTIGIGWQIKAGVIYNAVNEQG